MYSFQVLILVLACLVGHSAKAASAEVINVVAANWTDYTNKDGTGYLFEVLRAVYSPHDIELNIQFAPYSRSEFILKSGGADVLPGVYKDVFNVDWYSKYPVYIDIVDAAISHELNESWQGLSSLKGKRVVANTGYNYDSRLDLGAHYYEIGNIDSMIKMLAAGRVDAVLDYKIDLVPRGRSLKLDNMFVIKESLYKNFAYFVFHNPDKNNRYKEIFDKGFRRLIDTGELRAIMVKNFGDDQTYPDFSEFIRGDNK